jgi:hypothetical protein
VHEQTELIHTSQPSSVDEMAASRIMLMHVASFAELPSDSEAVRCRSSKCSADVDRHLHVDRHLLVAVDVGFADTAADGGRHAWSDIGSTYTVCGR